MRKSQHRTHSQITNIHKHELSLVYEWEDSLLLKASEIFLTGIETYQIPHIQALLLWVNLGFDTSVRSYKLSRSSAKLTSLGIHRKIMFILFELYIFLYERKSALIDVVTWGKDETSVARFVPPTGKIRETCIRSMHSWIGTWDWRQKGRRDCMSKRQGHEICLIYWNNI